MTAISAALLIPVLMVPAFAAEIRAARSVHLGYPAPDGDLFYTEMVVEQSVNGSYFMACGWNTGYFGLQQLDRPEDKVVIFSVWDPTQGDDPSAVKTEDRVELLYEGREYASGALGARAPVDNAWRRSHGPWGEPTGFCSGAKCRGRRPPIPRGWELRTARPGGSWRRSGRGPEVGP